MVDRRSLGMREMALAMGILVVALLAVLLWMGSISFGNSTDNGTAPTTDVVAGLQKAGPALDLPIAVPTGLPRSWTGNSFQLTDPKSSGGTTTLVRGGWLTAGGQFITLIQSPMSPADLVSSQIGPGTSSRGTTTAGGAQWTVYPGQRDETAWVRQAGGVTLLITGSAPESDFQVLAASISGS